MATILCPQGEEAGGLEVRACGRWVEAEGGGQGARQEGLRESL